MPDAPSTAGGATLVVEPLDVPESATAPTGKRRRKLGFGFWASLLWVLTVAVCAIFASVLPVADPLASDPCTTTAQIMVNTNATPQQALIMQYNNIQRPDLAQSLIDRGATPRFPEHGACRTPTLDARGDAYPSARHWLGTDKLGRDSLSRLVYGARVAMTVGVVAIAVGMIIGGTMGIVAGFFRGKVETAIMTVVDIMLAFPALVLAIAIVAFSHQSLTNVCIAVAIVATPAFARIARASTLTYSEREFVTAARVMGARNSRIMVREILPNAILPVAAFALVAVAVAIVAEGALAFIGLSVPIPEASWGSMIASGFDSIQDRPLTALLPAGVVFLTALAFNVLGDRFRTIFDVKDAAL